MDIHEANKAIQSGEWLVVDIRDEEAFSEGHIKGSKLLNNNNLKEFIKNTEKESKILCYCYHGISSKDAIKFLRNHGFVAVEHIEGGFEAWKEAYPYLGGYQ